MCRLCGALSVSEFRLSGEHAASLRRAIAANPPPAEIAYLADRIGAEATFVLLERLGGIRVYIPKEVNQGSPLVRELGLPAARALWGWRGGEDVKMPLCRFWRVRVWRHCGASYSVIARHFGVTEKAVHGLLAAQGLTNVKPEKARRRERRSAPPAPSTGNPDPCP